MNELLVAIAAAWMNFKNTVQSGKKSDTQKVYLV